MKSFHWIVFIGVICLLSCDDGLFSNLKDPEFSIEFYDGTIISEEDILFYDSSTCILFLEKDLYISYREYKDENICVLSSEFSVYVNKEIIYKGMVFPYLFAAMAPSPIFVFRDIHSYGHSILPIECYFDSLDFRNDSRIISALEQSGLLSHGISCSIESIQVKSFDGNSSTVTCTIKIKNNDQRSYYIIDPDKMGDEYFSHYSRGLYFERLDADAGYYLDSRYDPAWGKITLDDFFLLPGGNEVTYTFSSNKYDRMSDGPYYCSFHFRYKGVEVELDQEDGRIWIGTAYASLDRLVLKLE